MLIELINTDYINLENSQIEACIQNILCAHREGKHIIIADKGFLLKLAKMESLGLRNRNAAQNISQRIRELFPLKKEVNYYCKVDMSSYSSDILASNPDEDYFIVGCYFFQDSAKTQLTKLICEDINDYKIYEKIADYYKFTKNNNGINIKFEVINGGGSSTRNNFDQIKSNNLLCLCILDTDKKHPNAGVGPTAAKFTPSCANSLCKYHIITSHEVESLIPMEIIKTAISEGKLANAYSFSYDQLYALVTHSPHIKQYFDHKNGITINDACELDEKYNDNFWKEPLAHAQNFSRKGKCFKNLTCQCKKPCIAVPGFSSRLVEVSAEVLSRTSLNKLDSFVHSPLKEEWNNIGKILFSWGCTMPQTTRSS